MKEKESGREAESDWRIWRPAWVDQHNENFEGADWEPLEGTLTGMTSRPIPSPGKRPIRRDLEAIALTMGHE